MTHRRPLPLPLSLFICLMSSAASAAAPAVKPAFETLTVTATRISTPMASLSTSLSVVDQEDLLQVTHVHINELLNRVPGVWVSRGNGQEHLTAIRSPVLTGAGSCGAFYVAEDGVPVRPTGFCNVNELFDLNTEQAERIEVLRGPGTELHGSDALHGVINVLSQSPVEGGETRLALEGGSNDYGRVKLSTSDKGQRHGYSLNLNGASDGGYKDESGFDQQKMTARYDYYGDQWSSYSLLSASNLNQETAGYVSGKDAFKDEDRKRENGNPDAYRDSQSVRWQTRFERQLAKGGVFIMTPYARHSEMEFLMHFLPGTPVEENGQQSVGIQTTFSRPAGENLTLTQGVDLEFTDAFVKQTQAESTFSDIFPVGKQYDYEVKAQLAAAFMSGDYQLTPSTRLLLGGRYEYLRYGYDNRMIGGNTDENGIPCSRPCRYSRPDDRTDEFDNLSASFGLVQQLGDSHIVTARFSHGFRAPQATEMYRLQAGQVVPELDSEELNSIEVGIKGQAGPVSYEWVAFYMKKTNVIIQDSSRRNIDDGQTRHLGLEYQLNWQISDQWDLGINGTFAEHEYTADVSLFGSDDALSIKGNDVDTAPHSLAAAQLGWQPAEATRVELEWVSISKYYTDIDNLHSYEGHDLLHLRLRQSLGSQLSIGLRINNLTDEDYAERADFNSLAGGDRYFIGEPRSYYTDIQWRF